MNRYDFLIIPHFYNTGGSGKYISEIMITLSKKNLSFVVFGKFAKSFSTSYVHQNINLSISNYPNYLGVPPAKKIFYLIRALFFINKNKNKIRKALYFSDRIILTSSIQLVLLIYLSKLSRNYEKKTFYLFIQENININNSLKIIAFFVKKNKNIKIFCITKNILEKVESIELHGRLAYNKFNFNPKLAYSANKKYDLLYVGGKQRIKGVNFFIKIERLKKYNLLGIGFDKKDQLHFPTRVAFTKEINEYYLQAKILFIPILAYHFCRPAIEAGIHSVPFIITDFNYKKGFDDYIYPSFNCEVVKYNDTNDLHEKFNKIIKNYTFYSENAYSIASDFIRSTNQYNLENVFFE